MDYGYRSYLYRPKDCPECGHTLVKGGVMAEGTDKQVRHIECAKDKTATFVMGARHCTVRA